MLAPKPNRFTPTYQTMTRTLSIIAFAASEIAGAVGTKDRIAAMVAGRTGDGITTVRSAKAEADGFQIANAATVQAILQYCVDQHIRDKSIIIITQWLVRYIICIKIDHIIYSEPRTRQHLSTSFSRTDGVLPYSVDQSEARFASRTRDVAPGAMKTCYFCWPRRMKQQATPSA